MELPSTPESSSLEIDLSTEVDAEVYTSGYAFQQNLLRHQRPYHRVLICTYNVGINIATDYLRTFTQKLKGDVRMLVGFNPHNIWNTQIKNELRQYEIYNHAIRVQLEERQHAKFVIVEKTPYIHIGWCGSLNFINPTLYDVMVKLSSEQCQALIKYFDFHWDLAKPLCHVHAVNATTPPQ